MRAPVSHARANLARSIFALALVVLTTGCALLLSSEHKDLPNDAAPQANVVTMDPQHWWFLFSSGVGTHPLPDPTGSGAWAFSFPTWGASESDISGPGGHVNYLEVPFRATVPLHSISGSFKVESDSADWVVFGDFLPATCRIMLQRQNDDFSFVNGRFWANSPPSASPSFSPFDLGTQPIQFVSFVMPLTPDRWTNVHGQTDPQAFANLLAHLGWVGITFGGQDFAGHGNALSAGAAKFTLISLSIN